MLYSSGRVYRVHPLAYAFFSIFEPIWVAEKLWLKILFADLLWEKSIIEWLVIRKISSREKHYFYICQRSFVIY